MSPVKTEGIPLYYGDKVRCRYKGRIRNAVVLGQVGNTAFLSIKLNKNRETTLLHKRFIFSKSV